MSTQDTDRLLCWVDVETTGLDADRGAVLEVGIILTDWSLRELDARSWRVRFLGRVDPYIATMHGPGGSGLLRVANPGLGLPPDLAIWSCEGLPPSDVEAMARAWLHERCSEVAPLWAGRNVAFDRRWLLAHMPRLHDAIHHRSVDETPLRMALEAWAGVTVPKDPTAGTRHRTLDDLRESLRVMRRVRRVLSALRLLRGLWDRMAGRVA